MHPAVPSPPCTPREHQVFKLRDGKIAIRSVDNQKVAWRLARNWSRVAKREREREAAKVANLPSPPPPVSGNARHVDKSSIPAKTASKHKCSNFKVVRIGRKAAEKRRRHHMHHNPHHLRCRARHAARPNHHQPTYCPTTQ